jgi:SagB-type dehydrogenase family enzyme
VVDLSRSHAETRVTLEAALRGRRTVRQFGPVKVGFADLCAIVRGTWGRTGWLAGGPLGRSITKTSPSAGARHPIESYLLAWRVAELRPGLYHYDVRGDRLERLAAGDFRNVAVRMGGGQEWIAAAGFLCVMTAAADRVFWKYRSADAYRLFLLDAGHLAQTFVLLATARGLGSFTTAALDEGLIERTLGIDGVTEFPIYLCGAGSPRLNDSGARSSSRGRRRRPPPESPAC